jgi:hypothetical protein
MIRVLSNGTRTGPAAAAGPMRTAKPAAVVTSSAIERLSMRALLLLGPNDPPDFLTDVERLRRFLVYVGHGAAAKRLTRADLSEMRLVRDRVTNAMEAPDPAAAVARLDRMAETLEFRPRAVATTKGSWQMFYGPPPEEGPGFIGPSAVIGLLQLVVDGEWDRIGRCAVRRVVASSSIDRGTGAAAIALSSVPTV